MASGSNCWDHSSALTTNRSDVFGSSPRDSSTSKPDYYQELWAEFDLTSAQWSGAYHSARYGWDSFVSLKFFPGPRVSADYHEWWQIVCPLPLCQDQ